MKRNESRKSQTMYDYNVRLYEDGKYHWLYDLHLLKNPSVLIDVYKVLGITLAIVWCILFLIAACDDGFTAEGLGFVFSVTGIMAGIMFVLGLLGYLLYAAISGWVYSVEFTMDEKGVEHRQSPRSEKTARRIGFLTSMAGLASGKPSVVGAGIISASRTAMSSDFSNVKKVKAIRSMNTIMVNEPFGKNRVYTSQKDFDFVYEYICSHCPKAQKR